MFSNYNFFYLLLFVRILELPKVVYLDESVTLNQTGWDVRCKFQPNSYSCFQNKRVVKHRFYYDLKMQSCKTFREYGGCSLSYNSFKMLSDCSDVCNGVGNLLLSDQKMDSLATDVICRFQPDFGSCFGYQPMFYYDITTRSCKGFSFSGCGGNRNRFQNHLSCMDACEGAVPKEDIQFF